MGMRIGPQERMDMLAEEGEEPVNPAMAQPTPAMLAQLNEGEPMSPQMQVTPEIAQELDEEKKRQSLGETIGVGVIPTAEGPVNAQEVEDSVEEAIADAPDPEAALEDGQTLAEAAEESPGIRQKIEAKAQQNPEGMTPAEKVALIALSLGAGVVASQAAGDMMGEDATTGFLTLAAGASEGAAKYAAEQREDTKAQRAAEATRRKEQLALDKETRAKLEKMKRNASQDELQLMKTHLNNKVTKDSLAVNSAYEKVASASPNAAGDMSMIFGYMKLLDPTSTVREGEYATASQTTGIPGWISNMYNKAKDGTTLGPTQRKYFKDEAKKILNAQKKSQALFDKSIIEQTNRRGLNPANTIVDIFGTGAGVEKTHKGKPLFNKSNYKDAKIGDYIEVNGKVFVKTSDTGMKPE